MKRALARTHLSAESVIRDAASLIDDVVTDIRNRGFTREQAFTQAATELGIPLRRAKKLAYGEIHKIAADEYRTIQRRFARHLDAEAKHLTSRMEAVKQRRQNLDAIKNGPTGLELDATENRRPSP